MTNQIYKATFLPFLLAGTLLLSACSGLSSNLGCNQVQGVSTCTPMENVNDMANKGAFKDATRVHTNSHGDLVTSTATAPVSDASHSPPANLKAQGNQMGYAAASPEPGAKIRYSETVQEIWIAPWVDQDGNFHHANYIDVVVSPGHWIGSPPQAIRTEE